MSSEKSDETPISAVRIQRLIVEVRGQRVLLDDTLATLYGVTTKRLNEQVSRNEDRFPDDFMIRLTWDEWESLRSQNATSKTGRGGRRYPPRAFTEHGTVMAANVLNSPTAVRASIQVVRAFVQFREMLASHKDLSRRLDTLERKYDAQFKAVFDAVRELMTPPVTERRPLGFRPPSPKKGK
ncbi:MAG: ORF6N domain-containing protein [Candidatus Hydrogenedentes bacterium]|nr:ORF6N domain-containing protein [Candidatus Hydrogenedentota bacterium]